MAFPVYMKKPWTILIFMAADNDLAEMAKFSRRAMAKLRDDTNVHVVGQIHTRPIGGSGVERFHILCGRIEKIGESLPDLNTGDPRTLSAFLSWGCEHFPSERTALIIWGHGTGLENLPDDFDYSSIRGPVKQLQRELKRTLFSSTLRRLADLSPTHERGIAVDATARDYLDTEELQSALSAGLSNGTKLDLLGFDACLMGCVEIAYQLREVANVMISSQNPVPGLSWPYSSILNILSSNPDMSADELGAVIVDQYAQQVEQVPEPYSLAALDLQHVVKTFDLTKALVEALEPVDVFSNRSTKRALDSVTPSDPSRPGARDIVDFHGWCSELLYELRAERDLPHYKALTILKAHLTPGEALVRICKRNRAASKNTHGISTYWPREFYSSAYDTLDWSRSGWDRVVRRLFKQN